MNGVAIALSRVLQRKGTRSFPKSQVPDLLINRLDSSAWFVYERFKVPLAVLTRRSLVMCLLPFTPSMQKAQPPQGRKASPNRAVLLMCTGYNPKADLSDFRIFGTWDSDGYWIRRTHLIWRFSMLWFHTCWCSLWCLARAYLQGRTDVGCEAQLQPVNMSSCFVAVLLPQQLMSCEFCTWLRLLLLHMRLLRVIWLVVRCFSYHLGEWVLHYLFSL